VCGATGQQDATHSSTTATRNKSKVVPPKVIDSPNPAPAFYEKGRQMLRLRVIIGADGMVHDPVVVQSTLSDEADVLALEAVKNWRFKPAIKDAAAVSVQINVEINPRIMCR